MPVPRLLPRRCLRLSLRAIRMLTSPTLRPAQTLSFPTNTVAMITSAARPSHTNTTKQPLSGATKGSSLLVVLFHPRVATPPRSEG